MHGLVLIEGMTLSGHPWIINEILNPDIQLKSVLTLVIIEKLVHLVSNNWHLKLKFQGQLLYSDLGGRWLNLSYLRS